MKHLCPVCGYGLTEPAEDFNICPSCGTEFGYHDATVSHRTLRHQWLRRGAPWASRAIRPPAGWNPVQQLLSAGFDYAATTATATAMLETPSDATDRIEYAEAV